MAELTVSQLIKLVLGILVVVGVIIAVSLGFKENFFNFFKSFSLENSSIKSFLGFLG